MKVQINSDKNVDVSEAHAERMEADVGTALERYGDHLTRVEVHLRDESAGRPTGDDIRCLIEARPASRQPVVVTDRAPTTRAAFDGALEKLVALLGSEFGRLKDKDLRRTIRGG